MAIQATAASTAAIQGAQYPEILQQKAFLSDKEFCQVIGMARSTLWMRVKSGDLPAPVKVFGSTRWKSSDIRAMIDRLSAEAAE